MAAKQMRERTIVATVFVVIVFGLSSRLVLAFVRFARVEHNFAAIELGLSKPAVVARLGKPHYHSAPYEIDFSPPSACSSEYVYGHPLAPLLPDYYVISFSADGHVIEANRWTSP
jgi:hypothetical protein